MANYTIRVNLKGLLSAAVTTAKINGEEQKCIVIPVKPNNIFETSKGGFFLNLKAYEDNGSKYGKSHYVKQVIPLDDYTKLRDAHKQQPIIGSMEIAESKSTNTPPMVEFSDELKNLPF